MARLQQALTVLIVVAAVALAVAAAAWAQRAEPAGGASVWALPVVALLLPALTYAAVLALEFVLMQRVNGRAGHAQRLQRVLCAAWREFLAVRVFVWQQPWRSQSVPDHLPRQAADAAPQRGVVLVHGFFCNRGFWNPWLKRLRAMGVPVVAVNLEPIFGSIDAATHWLKDAVEEVRQAGGGLPPVVVAHSMGGLAVRAWQAGSTAPVHHLITLGSPHHGTWLARLGHTRNGRQMRLDSHWLQALAQREQPGAHAHTTCFWSACDNIVFPALTATLPGADNRELIGVAHVDMVHHPEPWQELLRRLV
jgi:triacylglycerol lipase